MSGRTAIDRMSIRVPGADAEHGRRVGELVAERLAPLTGPSVQAGALDHLRIELSARPGESAEALAGRIASAVARAIAGADVPEAGR